MAHEANPITMFEFQAYVSEGLHDRGMAIARADAPAQTRWQNAILE
jgi:hypothetical protein